MKTASLIIACLAIQHFCYAQKTTSLTALFEKTTKLIKLRWQHLDENVVSYTLQSSEDNLLFSDIFSKNVTEIRLGDFVKFSDKRLSDGKNYYRLKIFTKYNYFETTKAIMILPGNTESSWVMYPVPVKSVLNLHYDGNRAIEGVINVVIQSVTSGTVFTKLRLASTTRDISIPVSNIGRGIYDIRIYIGNEVVWNQRFVK